MNAEPHNVYSLKNATPAAARYSVTLVGRAGDEAAVFIAALVRRATISEVTFNDA